MNSSWAVGSAAGCRSRAPTPEHARGSCGCGGTLHLAGSDTARESPADLLGSPELSASEGSSPRDEILEPAITGSVDLKKAEHAFCAVGRPRRNQTSVGIAQRLRRPHRPLLLARAEFGA